MFKQIRFRIASIDPYTLKCDSVVNEMERFAPVLPKIIKEATKIRKNRVATLIKMPIEPQEHIISPLLPSFMCADELSIG